MGGVHRVLASSLNDALIDERRKESRGGMRGEEREGAVKGGNDLMKVSVGQMKINHQ